MFDSFKNVIRKMCIKAIVICPDFMNNVPDQYRTREMYTRLVEKDPGWLHYVPDRFNVVRRDPYYLQYVPDYCKTQKMCDDVVRRDPYYLRFIPDNLKTQGMYEKVVEKKPFLLHLFKGTLKRRRCVKKWLSQV